MDETVLSWTVPNWITVVMMVVIGFALLGLAGKVIFKARSKADA